MKKKDLRAGRERLQALAAYLPVFEAEGFRFGEWDNSDSEGRPIMPTYLLGEEASKWQQVCYEVGLVLGSFDWIKWMQTAEAQALLEDRVMLQKASEEQLARLLTALIRGDRFCEGTLAEAHKTGLIVAILRRAKSLVEGGLTPK